MITYKNKLIINNETKAINFISEEGNYFLSYVTFYQQMRSRS